MSEMLPKAKIAGALAGLVALELAFAGATGHGVEVNDLVPHQDLHDVARPFEQESVKVSLGPNKFLQFGERGVKIIRRAQPNFTSNGRKTSAFVEQAVTDVKLSNVDCIFNGAVGADISYRVLTAAFDDESQNFAFGISSERTVEDKVLDVSCDDFSAVSQNLEITGQKYFATS